MSVWVFPTSLTMVGHYQSVTFFLLLLLLFRGTSVGLVKTNTVLPSLINTREPRFLVLRLRPSRPMGGSRHREGYRDSNFQSLQTETHQDQRISKLSRPRLVETGYFSGCRDQDSLRLDENCRDRDFDETF